MWLVLMSRRVVDVLAAGCRVVSLATMMMMVVMMTPPPLWVVVMVVMMVMVIQRGGSCRRRRQPQPTRTRRCAARTFSQSRGSLNGLHLRLHESCEDGFEARDVHAATAVLGRHCLVSDIESRRRHRHLFSAGAGCHITASSLVDDIFTTGSVAGPLRPLSKRSQNRFRPLFSFLLLPSSFLETIYRKLAYKSGQHEADYTLGLP